MELTVWGCRGSIPTPPSPEEIERKIARQLVSVHKAGGLDNLLGGMEVTEENVISHYFPSEPAAMKTFYGGETTCYEIRTSDDKLIMVDFGSGARKLGLKLLREMPLDTTVLLTHLHWDHIIGFPFFTPAYVPGNAIKVYGVTREDFSGENQVGIDSELGTTSKALERYFKLQMSRGVFPYLFEDLPSKIDFYKGLEQSITVGNAKITSMRTNHPDPTLAYKIEDNGKTIIIATDHEHYIPEEGVDVAKFPDFIKEAHGQLQEFAKGADLLLYDAQYTPEQYNPDAFGAKGLSHVGWGHSTYKHGIDLALNAGVKLFGITHHEPTHNDDMLDSIKFTARGYMLQEMVKKGIDSDAMNLMMAHEKRVITI